MGPTRNPFSPGAGARPPELASREAIVEAATIAMQRIARDRQEKSQMLLGLRGVGKTVLLNRIAQIAEDMGAYVVTLEAPEGQRLAAFLRWRRLPVKRSLTPSDCSIFPKLGLCSSMLPVRPCGIRLMRRGAMIEDEALNRILQITEGYPYFLQEWGKHSWNTAAQSPIQATDVGQASRLATEALDRSFFRVRFDRLTPREQDYLRAMASLGPGPHRSGDIAEVLRISVQTAGPLRSGLIRKGMIWSPAHGQTAFTVPMFDAFMVLAMPEWKQTREG